jgi:hypothetical protein
MITNITANGSPLLWVSTGGSTMPYINMNAPSSGMMRWNGNNNSIEVFDGSTNLWQQMYGKTADIQLSPQIQAVINWANLKMAEESEWEKLAKTNDAVKIALENMKKAKQQLDITAKLVKDHNETTS